MPVPSSIEIPSSASGSDLAAAIGDLIGMEGSCLKLISNGRVISDTLHGLKPGSKVMVVRIDRNDDQWQVIKETKDILEDTRNDARLLGNSDDDHCLLMLRVRPDGLPLNPTYIL